jgi:hypothetical protein
MTTPTIPAQRQQLVTCPYCPAIVPGLLVGCCGSPECLVAANDADAITDFWSEACDE